MLEYLLSAESARAGEWRRPPKERRAEWFLAGQGLRSSRPAQRFCDGRSIRPIQAMALARRRRHQAPKVASEPMAQRASEEGSGTADAPMLVGARQLVRATG